MESKLKQIRIKKGYNAKTMAELLGISKAYYSQIENKKRNLSYRLAINIANILNTKPDDIFYEEYNEK